MKSNDSSNTFIPIIRFLGIVFHRGQILCFLVFNISVKGVLLSSVSHIGGELSVSESFYLQGQNPVSRKGFFLVIRLFP